VESAKTGRENAVIRITDIKKRGLKDFDLAFSADMLAAAAKTLSVSGISKARITGKLRATDQQDWILTAKAGASVVQPCSVTLAPVKTRIDEDIKRIFVAHWQEPENDSVLEMDENVETEPLGHEIDLEQIALEAISLALPAYPRASGAVLETSVFTEPGTAPLTDEDVKPFAALSALKDKLGD